MATEKIGLLCSRPSLALKLPLTTAECGISSRRTSAWTTSRLNAFDEGFRSRNDCRGGRFGSLNLRWTTARTARVASKEMGEIKVVDVLETSQDQHSGAQLGDPYANIPTLPIAAALAASTSESVEVVEECFPAGALSPEEELDVAFSSFPDSMSQGNNRASIHDSFFFFRIRRRGVVVSSFSTSTVRRTTSLLTYEPLTGVSPVGSPAKDGIESLHRSREGSPASEHVQLSTPHADSSHFQISDDHQSPRTPSAAEVATMHRTDVESPQQGEGVWGSVPVPNLIASVLSPRLRFRDPGSESPREGQSYKVGNGSPQHSQTANKDRGNGSFGNSHGISGSGGPRYLYGFVFNRQRQDERLKRGGEQKSLVILSERPFLCVFKALVQILGPLYFDIGSKALELVASEVSLWPAPLHGQQMELPVANSTIRTHLPPAHTLPPSSGNPLDEFTSAIAPAAPVTRSVPQGVFQQADLFGMFRGVLMQLWVLWELLLVGEPLLVVAPTPSQSSEAVAALVGLVAPLPCSVDFRPYFTIHDPDFATLNALKEGEPVPPMVLGVTNPFFLKALRNFSNVISVGSTAQTNANRFKSVHSLPPNGVKRVEGRLQQQLQLQISPLKRFSPTNLLKSARDKKDGPSSLLSEHKEALWSNFVACTKPDTNVLNRLVDAGVTTPRTEESVTLVNNDILQRHFTELTTNFLSPFGPYLRASSPQEGASPFADPPLLPTFDVQEFLDGLAARGSGKFLAKRLRGNWLELYRRFLKGPNFMPWFRRRRSVAEQEQHRIWRQARSKADVRGFLAKMSEVEIIDAFSAIERHLLNELQIVQRAGLGNSEGPICQKLRSDLRAIFNVLPKDMQQMLLFNPTRASLLQGGRELTKHPGRASFHFRNAADDIARKAESFKIRNCSSPELTGNKSVESPPVVPRLSPLAVRGAASRAEELAQDPLDLEKL